MNHTLPVHAVKAVIVNDRNEILFVKRNLGRGVEPNWDLPGGLVEEGEDDAVALRREINEELGIDAEVKSERGKWTFFRPSDHQTVNVTNFAANLKEGEITLSNEHMGYDWISFESVKELAVKDQSLFTALGS